MSRFLSSRSRAVRMSALVSLLMVMGCPTTSDDTTTTGTNVVPAVLSHAGSATPSTTLGSTVTGTVLGAGNSPLSGVTVTLTDARAIQVPNSGDAKTDGSGKFTLKQVPASSTWLVLADVDGNRMAGVVKPNAKKPVDCKITLTTTLAISGIQPYFVEDVKAPDRVVYDLRDLPIDKFDALVAAIDNSQSKPDIKPSPRIKDLNATFTSLKEKDPAVKAAFDALFQQIQLNSLVRQAGGTPDPNASVPKPSGAPTSPSPSPTATVSLSTPVPTPTPTPAPATPTPEPTKNYSPLNVTLTDDPPAMASTASILSTTKVTVGGQTALLVPDGSKIRVIAAVPGIPDLDPATSLGAAVDGITSVASNGATVYALGNVGGVYSVISLTLDATLNATATSKPIALGAGLAAIQRTGGLAWVSIKNRLVASDPDQHVLVLVDPLTGDTTLYAGIAGKSDTPGDPGGGAALGYGLNTPAGLVFYNGEVWVCDSGNHRILRCDTATNNFRLYAGKADTPGSVAGPTTSSRFQTPVGICEVNGVMYVADSTDNCIRILNLPKADTYITTGTKTDNNQFIFKCRLVGELNGKIYAGSASGKLEHFDPPTLPN